MQIVYKKKCEDLTEMNLHLREKQRREPTFPADEFPSPIFPDCLILYYQYLRFPWSHRNVSLESSWQWLSIEGWNMYVCPWRAEIRFNKTGKMGPGNSGAGNLDSRRIRSTSLNSLINYNFMSELSAWIHVARWAPTAPCSSPPAVNAYF